MVDEEDYRRLPAQGPIAVGVGHALLTMVQPHAGHERAYNRWYEDDHFFAGALFAPWLFAGRRWVSPRALQALRTPAGSTAVSDPASAGSYLTTYWIAPGRVEEAKAWAFSINDRLIAEGRSFHERSHVFTSFVDHVGTVYRDPDSIRDVFTLMDPAPGLVLQWLDVAEAVHRPGLEQWLLDDHLPAALPGGPVTSTLVFRTNAPDKGLPADIRATLDPVPDDGRGLVLANFLDCGPEAAWDWFLRQHAVMDNGGPWQMAFAAPFVPSAMGTDRYVDSI